MLNIKIYKMDVFEGEENIETFTFIAGEESKMEKYKSDYLKKGYSVNIWGLVENIK